MPTTLDRDRIRQHLENVDLRSLFIEELGWDHGGTTTETTVAGRTFAFFDAYQWHMADRPLRKDNESNPNVLGYI